MSENTQNPVSNQDIFQAIQAMDHKFTAANDDILSAVNTSFTTVETEWHDIRQDISGIKGEIGGLKQDVVEMKQDISGMKGELSQMVTKEDFKQEMVKVVTKEYLDDKLSDLKGDLVGLIRKEDRKVDTVVNILHDHTVLTGQDLEQINQVGLFPKTTTKMTTA